MKNKRRGLEKVFFIFCLAILVSQCLGAAQTDQDSQKLRDFVKHVEQYQDLDLHIDEYLAVLGWVYRLQWDKVLQMDEDDVMKAGRKQHMEQLWWELRDYAYREGEKWKKEGVWASGREGMFEQLKGGFEMRGKLASEGTEKVKALSLIPSMFEEDRGGNENYDDVSVEALVGYWVIEGTYLSTGQNYWDDKVDLDKIRNKLNSSYPGDPDGYTFYAFALHWQELPPPALHECKLWQLTDDGTIKFLDNRGKTLIEFFWENKDYWSGVIDTGDGKVQLGLYRKQ